MSVAFLGCPPPDDNPWVWTTEDSVAIVALMEQEKTFLSSQDDLPRDTLAVTLSSEVWDGVRSDTSSKRYVASAFSLSVTDSSCAYGFDSGIDTTVTAYVYDTLKGTVQIHVDSLFAQGSDSAAALDTTLTKTLRYTSRSAVFFDSLGGDAVWRIAKYSGGTDGQTPDVAGSPSLDTLYLACGSGELAVVFTRDTLSPNYAIRGLYTEDSLIHISAGGSVQIKSMAVLGSDTLLFFVKGAGDWLAYEPDISLTFPSKGKYRLYVMGINYRGLVWLAEEFASVLWAVPVIVE